MEFKDVKRESHNLDVNSLCQKAASALINWQKSQDDVKNILIEDGLNEEEAHMILATVVPALQSQKRKEAINNLIIGIIISVAGFLLIWWTSSLHSRAKWVIWAFLLFGLRYIYKGIKLFQYKIK